MWGELRRFANSLILLRFKPCIINEMAKNAEINIEQSQEEPFMALSTFFLSSQHGKTSPQHPSTLQKQ